MDNEFLHANPGWCRYLLQRLRQAEQHQHVAGLHDQSGLRAAHVVAARRFHFDVQRVQADLAQRFADGGRVGLEQNAEETGSHAFGVVAAADKALYKAKLNGRNRVTLASGLSV